jgi:hypothetical protein
VGNICKLPKSGRVAGPGGSPASRAPNFPNHTGTKAHERTRATSSTMGILGWAKGEAWVVPRLLASRRPSNLRVWGL